MRKLLLIVGALLAVGCSKEESNGNKKEDPKAEISQQQQQQQQQQQTQQTQKEAERKRLQEEEERKRKLEEEQKIKDAQCGIIQRAYTVQDTIYKDQYGHPIEPPFVNINYMLVFKKETGISEVSLEKDRWITESRRIGEKWCPRYY
jgi:predicted Holliday junction resolvase-like endonuclease